MTVITRSKPQEEKSHLDPVQLSCSSAQTRCRQYANKQPAINKFILIKRMINLMDIFRPPDIPYYYCDFMFYSTKKHRFCILYRQPRGSDLALPGFFRSVNNRSFIWWWLASWSCPEFARQPSGNTLPYRGCKPGMVTRPVPYALSLT